MSRLIDADVLKKHYAWWNNEEKEIFDAIVDAQPTAFDVEKVVEQLEELSGIQFDGENESYELNWCIETRRATEIVLNGGKE